MLLSVGFGVGKVLIWRQIFYGGKSRVWMTVLFLASHSDDVHREFIRKQLLCLTILRYKVSGQPRSHTDDDVSL